MPRSIKKAGLVRWGSVYGQGRVRKTDHLCTHLAVLRVSLPMPRYIAILCIRIPGKGKERI